MYILSWTKHEIRENWKSFIRCACPETVTYVIPRPLRLGLETIIDKNWRLYRTYRTSCSDCWKWRRLVPEVDFRFVLKISTDERSHISKTFFPVKFDDPRRQETMALNLKNTRLWLSRMFCLTHELRLRNEERCPCFMFDANRSKM